MVFELEGVPLPQNSAQTPVCQYLYQQGFSLATLLTTLPLNVIPIVGTMGFVVINGFVHAWALHEGFLAGNKGLAIAQQVRYIRSSFRAYAMFGIVAIVLSAVPFLGVMFIYTNTIGSALWAIDLELSGQLDNYSYQALEEMK